MTEEPEEREVVYGALARAEALCANHPDWMNVTQWPPAARKAPEPGWNDKIEGFVVKVTDHWVVVVTPMIFNDRINLCEIDHWDVSIIAGFCYDKGGAAHLAALAWDPETEELPVGYKKLAYDAR